MRSGTETEQNDDFFEIAGACGHHIILDYQFDNI
jgi:hypothetical protein